MASMALTCGLWLLLAAAGVSSFNLDDEKVQRKNGPADSLFGFSLAMHRQMQPQDRTMVLVGAPRAKKLPGQTSKVTGGLYSCDMTSGSTDCARVIFDNHEDRKKESKENQWMGVSVKSQGPGGTVVTCAHRYQHRANVDIKNLESRHIIGRCYVMSQDLVLKPNGNEGSWHFCEGRSPGHEMFGSCQQGLSATFDKDYHYLIFGAPGAYNWKGIVRLEQKNDTFFLMDIFDDGPFEVGDENLKNPDLVPAPVNSYMGFSLDSGKRLVKERHLTVVAGAPRAFYSGAVMLLKKGDDTSNILNGEFTLKGPGLASSFGYDLTVLDLNNDGWEDLVVGAPQYFEKDSKIGGAIFIYINDEGKWNNLVPTRIDGEENSMFGLSVETLGDVNQDGFEDFAVGAPYADDEAGRVYIYHGSKKVPEKPKQILYGKPLNVQQFGYSLAGNMDLDKNSYPDVAVGSLSDAIFVFKARPVINVEKKIQFIPSEIDLTNKNCGENFCLTIKACFSFTANSAKYSPRLTVKYRLEADAALRKKGLLSRVTFTPAGPESFLEEGTVVIEGQGKEQCIQRKITVQDSITDKLHGLPIDVSVEIQKDGRQRRDTSGTTPVLDANESPTKRFEVQFRKEGCGGDNICESDLQVNYRFGHKPSPEDPFTPVELKDGVPVFTLSDQEAMALELKVTNANADDAHEATMTISFPRYLTFSSFDHPTDGPVSCAANKNGSMVDCKLGNPFLKDSEATFYIIIGTVGISYNNTELEVDLLLDTTSNQTMMPVKAKAQVAIVLQLSLTGQAQPSQVYFSKNAKGEGGSAITHQFRIINLGKSLEEFGTAMLYINWPKEITEKKSLLYLTKISHTGVDQIDCTPKDEINPKKKLLSRSRRDLIDQSTLSRVVDPKKTKILSCNDGANCVTIKCPLRGMDSSAVINLHSRLWDPTLAEYYSKYHYVEVKVIAKLEIESAVKNAMLQKSQTEVRLTIFPERTEASHSGVPWWIIVLTILLILMLLALLAFLLWKMVFFKRAKYEEQVPSHSAVRIRREERAVRPGNVHWENLEKNPWQRTWRDKGHDS